MIVKGRARSGGAQLAAYLLRSEEGAVILSPGVTPEDLHRDLVMWEAIGEGTRGEKPLYHPQICPDAKYGNLMTPEQWLRGGEILAEELGMAHHPWRIVLHPNGPNPHAHLVFPRTDFETMKQWPTWKNYLKHEKASQRMALEFGHELVPGKHAKRDRKKQEKFPRAESTQADHQQAERTALTVEQRKEQITALRAAADSAPAFKAALADAGYVLAKGDKRGLVIVDQAGEVYSLSKQVQDIKGKDFKAFMAPLDPEKMPSVQEAKALQEQAKIAPKPEPLPEAQKQGAEASKFLQPQAPAKAPEPTPPPQDAEFERVKKALAERQAEDMKKWDIWHAHELRQKQFELDKDLTAKLALRQADDLKALNDLKDKIRERSTGLKGIIEAIENRWNPGLGAERAKERREEIALLMRRQDKERKDYEALIQQSKQLEIDNLKARQGLQRHDTQQKHVGETERYTRDREAAVRLRDQVESQKLEKTESLREGPKPPTLGKP